MAMLTNPLSGPSAGTGALAATGLVAGVSDMLWLAVLLIVAGGTVMTAMKLGPRVALEPLRAADGRHRWTLTVNGRAIGSK